MNDEDRWINLEGPEPPWVRELLDAACYVPELSSEEEARRKRAIHRALDEQTRTFARRHRWAWAAAGSVVVAGTAAAATFLALWLRSAQSPLIAGDMARDALEAPLLSPSATAAAPSTAPRRTKPPVVPPGGPAPRPRLR
jgi:hypothetical protein